HQKSYDQRRRRDISLVPMDQFLKILRNVAADHACIITTKYLPAVAKVFFLHTVDAADIGMVRISRDIYIEGEMDARTLDVRLVCALRLEAWAVRKLGLPTVHVGIGCSLGIPEGRVISVGFAGG